MFSVLWSGLGSVGDGHIFGVILNVSSGVLG